MMEMIKQPMDQTITPIITKDIMVHTLPSILPQPHLQQALHGLHMVELNMALALLLQLVQTTIGL